MPTRRQRLIQRHRSAMIDPTMPWRYDPRLDDEERYIVFNTVEPRWTQSLEEQVYWPDKRELPEDGGWVLCIRPPHVMNPPTFGGFYFAVPYTDGVKGFKGMKYSVTCYTEHGEVRMWPYEYGFPPIEEMIEFWADGLYEFHPYEDLAGDEFNERLFYVQSRGIPLTEALPMILGDVKRPIGWFEPKEV